MQKMYEALEAAHPGFQVVDVKFMANPGDADNQKAKDLDGQFAESVRSAREVTAEAFQ